MTTVPERAEQFLASSVIAVVGVSDRKQTPANAVYDKLRAQGRTVVPVNPRLDRFKEEACYRDLLSVPVPVEAVFISAKASVTEQMADQCIARNVRRVWMHDMTGTRPKAKHSPLSSVSRPAAERCRAAGIAVIAGACPMMFLAPVDGFHACWKWLLNITGRLPAA
ncbi:MAG: CoA-binding protein [Bacteroidetes bacterium]|nr:MAG: CoA-binding protein [Bacteroidota bacterium]